MPQPPPLPPRAPSDAGSGYSITWSSEEEEASRAPWTPATPRVNTVHLTPQSKYPTSGDQQTQNHPYSGGTNLDDPRSSSTQSLRPLESAGPNRRRLLLVYLHGFMGNETSFKSFPAHVHNLLSISLAETHVVHTKIYPRYASRKNVSYARDAFSNWLTPHEDDNTDVVLIGHSLGGILAAEVVLLPSHCPGSNDVFQHRILGHIAYDTPFLGMHPGVVSTGLASLFKSAPDPPQAPAYDQDSSSSALSINPFAEPTDPNYNPTYNNDVNMVLRKGKLDRAFYFLNKHYGEWQKATTAYVKSHLEFGGCMADYDGLKKRYRSFRPLEDIDDLADARAASGRRIPRVRFVNYYTASTGRIKPQPPHGDNQNVLVAGKEMTEQHSPLDVPGSVAGSQPSPPRISIEEHRGDRIVAKEIEDLKEMDSLHLGEFEGADQPEMQSLDPQPEPPSPDPEPSNPDASHPPPPDATETDTLTQVSTHNSLASPADTASITSSQIFDVPLPPLPEPPTAPLPFDPAPYTTADPSTLKLAQKEHDRLVKSYERAKKDHDKSLREREKHLAKLEKARKKQEEKELAGLSAHEKSERARLKKEEERMQKERERMEGKAKKEEPRETETAKEEQSKRSATMNLDAYDAAMARQEEEEERALVAEHKKRNKPPRQQKDRKFCTLPKKDERTGQRDPTWIRVYMENMDEVVAHTSLFFVSDAYAKLVGDTAERIEQWLTEDATIRAVKEAQAWEQGHS